MADSVERHYHLLRQKIVFHIKELSNTSDGVCITPRQFHMELLLKFPGTIARESVTRLFWEMTDLDTSRKWVYHKLRKEYLDYDRGFDKNSATPRSTQGIMEGI